MVELEPDDPRVVAAAADLLQRLQPYVGQHFDTTNVGAICELVKDHRDAFKRDHNADFPPLVPFVLPSLRYIHFVRADIDEREIAIQLRNIIVQLSRRPGVFDADSAMEIDMAAKQCWRLYRSRIEELRADPLLRQRLQ
jgi:hypothetical protein